MTALPKPGDMSALAIAAAKLSMADGSSSASCSRQKDSPREAKDKFASHRGQHRSREDVGRRDDPLLFDDSPSPRKDVGSKKHDSLGGKDLLVFDESPKAKRDTERQTDRRRAESPLRFDESPSLRPAAREHKENFSLDDGRGPVRVFPAKTAVPQDLSFTVPQNCRAGQPVCMQGPHGPIRVPLPQGYQPGERCSIRFGPTVLHQVQIPKDHRPGDSVKFEGSDGEQLEAIPPEGKQPGDYFEVSPPVLMVQVPEGAVEGDVCSFSNPAGIEVQARVPKGIHPGQYFAARIDM